VKLTAIKKKLNRLADEIEKCVDDELVDDEFAQSTILKHEIAILKISIARLIGGDTKEYWK